MRRVIAVLVVILFVFAGAGAGAVYLVRRAFPQTSGSIVVPGVREPVEVLRDRWGIPHIFAESDRDLFFAQGFVHAQDRLWQMELNRRAASGRLSEIFGETTLAADRLLRTIGLRRTAEAHLSTLSPRAREILEAYAAGVNAAMAVARRRPPLEFMFLGLSPEPWTPVDTLAYGKLMAWVLGGDWRTELLRQQLIERFGDRILERLLPEYPKTAPVIVPDEGARIFGPAPQAAAPDPVEAFTVALVAAVPGLGSNNWVVAGDRTATGGPLLANDPHLEAQMPAIWYIMHLNGGAYDVAGATFPGVPGVIVGHNRDIAWGVTNANPDVQDLYVERFHPDDPTRYLFKDEWRPVTVIREEIRVKGRSEPVTETVYVTQHGVILNNVVRGLNAFLALRWTATDSGTIVEAVDAINRATTWEEFREALRLWDTPSQNFVFAHRNGEIGYQLPGRIPMRAKGSGAVPVPGWTGEYEWTGWIPFEQLPSMRRRSGTIVTANNRIAPPGYAHFLGRDWDPGFRARRIGELLSQESQSIDTFRRIHADVTSLPGRAVVEALRPVRIQDPALRSLFDELLAWDGVLEPSSRAAATYQAFTDALVRELFRGPLDEAVFSRYLRHQVGPVLTVLALLRDPNSKWWRGNRDAVVESALRQAVRTLERRLGRNRAEWRWGRLHRPRFVHPMGRIAWLSRIFNATPPETGGGRFTVNIGAYNPEEPFQQAIVASYRQILDPLDWDNSLVIHTTGQSGLPFHRHYRDFVGLWARGEYVPLLFSRPRIEENVARRLILKAE